MWIPLNDYIVLIVICLAGVVFLPIILFSFFVTLESINIEICFLYIHRLFNCLIVIVLTNIAIAIQYAIFFLSALSSVLFTIHKQ